MQFCWRIGDIDYVLQEVHPLELAMMRKKNPWMMGIPRAYTIVDGEVEWFPQTLRGWPQVYLFSPL